MRSRDCRKVEINFMFTQFWKDIDELRAAIEKIRNVWIPFTPKLKGSLPSKSEYMITDDNIIHVRIKTLTHTPINDGSAFTTGYYEVAE